MASFAAFVHSEEVTEMESAMRNRQLGRRWQFGRDRRRHRGDLNVIGLASTPTLSPYLPTSKTRAWKIVLVLAATLLTIGAVQSSWGITAMAGW